MSASSTFDHGKMADQIDVETGVVDGLVSNCQSDVTITDIHGYWGAIAIVELEDGITAQNADKEPYALLSWSGHLFPFSPDDTVLIELLMERADEEFEQSEDAYEVLR